MLIDGHVSSWTTAGVFHELRELKQGDMINVERGDGTTFDYKVVTTQVYKYDAVDMNKVLAPIDPARPGLNLITCSGQVVDGTNDFSRRLVVFASQQ
jgi:LPXTG-site transpeptidase (sortase) family protein